MPRTLPVAMTSSTMKLVEFKVSSGKKMNVSYAKPCGTAIIQFQEQGTVELKTSLSDPRTNIPKEEHHNLHIIS